jgi:hypothetical protein
MRSKREEPNDEEGFGELVALSRRFSNFSLHRTGCRALFSAIYGLTVCTAATSMSDMAIYRQ